MRFISTGRVGPLILVALAAACGNRAETSVEDSNLAAPDGTLGGRVDEMGSGEASGGLAEPPFGTAAGGAGGLASGGQAATAGGGTGGAGTGGTNEDATCLTGVWDGSPPEVQALTGSTFAHDPTMIKSGDTYYRFWTGDFVQAATSTNLTHWTNAPSVLEGTYSPWVDEWLSGISGETFNFPWAPDVSYFGGKYHIYSTFSAKFGDNISCITHLSTNDLSAGGWQDEGPIFCTDGTENYNAIDADVSVDRSGTPFLAFGSFWGGIYGFELNQDGSRKDQTTTHLAWANQIEAPVLFYRCGYYYLFVTWGLCCPGEGRTVEQLTYRVAVGRSTNILGPYEDREGTALTEGGGTLLVEGDGATWAAAGHSDVMVDGREIYHLYHAYRKSDGGAELRIVELPFDSDGWPVGGGP